VPLYEYQCETCGRFEIIRKFSDSALSDCPKCGNGVEKLPSAPAIQFKGTGWYVTDYGRKSSGPETKGDGESKESSKKPSKEPSKDSSTPKTDTPTKSAAASSSTTT
jgi:putative FmdB family regulatory protein